MSKKFFIHPNNMRMHPHVSLTESSMPRNTFPLKEHLKSKKAIERLYAEGTSVTAYPLRAVFIEQTADEQEVIAAILISVAKKRFRHAVDRNLVKRRIREAYRTSKHTFVETLQNNGKRMAVAILYIDTRHNSTAFIKRKMERLLDCIIAKSQVQ